MTVGAASNQLRKAEPIVLAMIAFHIGVDRDGHHPVALHHFLIGMALHADLGVEVAIFERFRIPQRFDFVQVMAIVTGRRILVAGEHRLAVDRIAVVRHGIMTLGALVDDYHLVSLPRLVAVQIGMTIGADDFIEHMHAGVVLGRLLLVTAGTFHRTGHQLATHVLSRGR